MNQSWNTWDQVCGYSGYVGGCCEFCGLVFEFANRCTCTQNLFVIVYRFSENIFLKEQGVDNDDR